MLFIPLETSLRADFDWVIKIVDTDAQVLIVAGENLIHLMSSAMWTIQLFFLPWFQAFVRGSQTGRSYYQRPYGGFGGNGLQLGDFVQQMDLRTLLETTPETREGIRMGSRMDGFSSCLTRVLNEPCEKRWHWNASLRCFWIREGWPIFVLPHHPVPCNEVTSDETAWLR